MPLVYQQNINDTHRLLVWQIQEEESYFNNKVMPRYTISNSEKRLQHLAGCYLLKSIFSNFPLAEVIGTANQKPYLVSKKYQFSVSHSGKYVAAIAGPVIPTGVDLERRTVKPYAIRSKYLTDEEFLLAKNLSLTLDDFCTISWTIKECIFKWYGRGEVDFKQHIQIRTIAVEDEKYTALVFFTKEQIELKLNGFIFEAFCLSYLIQ